MNYKWGWIIVPAMLVNAGCTKSSDSDSNSIDPKKASAQNEKTVIDRPLQFSGQTAFGHVEKQVSFGPRTAESTGHQKTLEWISDHLKTAGFKVQIQEKPVIPSGAQKFTAKNIIGSLGEGSRRLLLTAHWDTRPNSDQDANEKLKNKPVLGANDGGSGVGVLLEIARIFGKEKLPSDVGLDLIFFDAEDLGEYRNPTSFCLGSQAWGREPHVSGYSAQMSINLDMVGAKGAVFPREKYSIMQAATWVTRLWETAAELGYGKIFINDEDGPVVDDHFYVASLRGIPSVNVIHFDQGRFFPGWHTQQDDMRYISKETLEAVGRTIEKFTLKFGSGQWKN
jgi:glutaminyl-peptide cyclotransferase